MKPDDILIHESYVFFCFYSKNDLEKRGYKFRHFLKDEYGKGKKKKKKRKKKDKEEKKDAMFLSDSDDDDKEIKNINKHVHSIINSKCGVIFYNIYIVGFHSHIHISIEKINT